MQNLAISFLLFFLFLMVVARASDISDSEDQLFITVAIPNQEEEENGQGNQSHICGIPRLVMLDKILEGGNIVTACLWAAGKGYWLVSYVAQAGCTLATSDIFNKIVSDSSWAWKDCKIYSPCDPELASPVLCKLDQVGDMSGYINLGFVGCSCALLGYKIYKFYQEKLEADYNEMILRYPQ